MTSSTGKIVVRISGEPSVANNREHLPRIFEKEPGDFVNYSDVKHVGASVVRNALPEPN